MFLTKDVLNLEKFGKDHLTTVGLAATLVGIISFIPVLMVVHDTKKTHNFPYNTLYLALASNSLWMIYGLWKNAKATIIMGLLYFAIYAFILYTKAVH